MIVITLTKVPPSLRGSLTLWCQEIQTGVYVGNVTARIRDRLWERIIRDIGSGQATMTYNAQNELGYQFRTTRDNQEVKDFERIPLLVRLNKVEAPRKPGFSTAAKMHRARISNKGYDRHRQIKHDISFVSLDIETTGLDVTKNSIISIGAMLHQSGNQIEQFYMLVNTKQRIPANIVKLTNLTDELVNEEGEEIAIVLNHLRQFVRDYPIVGFNLPFDDDFISAAYRKNQEEPLSNRLVDVLPLVKRTNKFLDNYKLGTVLRKYGIVNDDEHNALSDARATMMLTLKLIENGVKVF